MKRSVVAYLVGKILWVTALLLLLPVVIGLVYREPVTHTLSYLSVSIAVALFGTLLSYKKPTQFKIRARDGIVTVALGWILLSVFGAIPFVLTGEIPHFVDAFFEVASGFTTTGSSVLSDLSVFTHASLFWRSFTHLIGGMGVLVFTLAILPNSSDYVELMRAEVPGPVFGKLVSKLRNTARILYGLYLAMTLALVIILVLVKVPVFDAFLLAFGTAGTGGFGIHNAGFAIYEHAHLVEWIIGVGMMLFGINFNLYYFILLGHLKDILKSDEELRYYGFIIVGATFAICLNIAHLYASHSDMIRHAFFTVVSVMTTTGFATADFDQWPLFTQMLLVLLMFVGGCAGSTAGGIKLSRVIMYVKCAFAELRRIGQPRRQIVPLFSGKPISKDVEYQISNYLLVYVFMFIVILFSVSLEAGDFTTAFTSVAATMNNIGPGLNRVGATQNFGFYSDWNKLVLTFSMLAGRLELYPMILLFSPKTLKGFAMNRYS